MKWRELRECFAIKCKEGRLLQEMEWIISILLNKSADFRSNLFSINTFVGLKVGRIVGKDSEAPADRPFILPPLGVNTDTSSPLSLSLSPSCIKYMEPPKDWLFGLKPSERRPRFMRKITSPF